MKAVRLRHVANVWTSSVDKLSKQGETPVRLCNYVDVYRSDRVFPNPDSMHATATPEEVARFRLQVGDTVLTKDSEDPSDIGISAYVQSTDADFVCGYHLAIVRPLSGVHPRYLTWALRSRRALHHFSARASGISRYGLALSDLRSAPVSWWEPDDQRRIADFLDDRIDRIDQIIAARRSQIRLVQDSYSAWLDSWTDWLGARHGWASIRRFGARIGQGWSPEADSVPAATDEAGVLKLGSVRGGEFRPQENKAFLAGSSPRPEFRVHVGDLLMTRANTPALVGDAAVVRADCLPELYLSDLIYRLDIDGYSPDLASACLRSSRTRQLIAVIARGTSSSMPKLRGEDLMGFQLPRVPPAERQVLGQRDIEERAVRDLRVDSLCRSVDRLAEFKQSLITGAVTGEMDVTTARSGIPG